eukprot:1470500-Pyramimonas_sp.AAC.1
MKFPVWAPSSLNTHDANQHVGVVGGGHVRLCTNFQRVRLDSLSGARFDSLSGAVAIQTLGSPKGHRNTTLKPCKL